MFRWLVTIARWVGEQQPGDSPQPSPAPEPREPGEPDEDGEGATKPFLDHLEDLRRMLFKIAAALFIGFNICLIFAAKIFVFLVHPLVSMGYDPEKFLISIGVTDSFVLSMQLAFYCGVVIASPAIFYFLGQFVLPALRKKERELLVPTFLYGAVLFIAGAMACYYLMIPQTLKMFIKYSEWMKIKPQWTVTSYVGFITQFMLSCGITFEVPLVILMMVRLGIVSAATVARGRKVMIASAVILAAILAPPDPLSMIYMAIPLLGICEITIWLAKFVEFRRNKRLAREREKDGANRQS